MGRAQRLELTIQLYDRMSRSASLFPSLYALPIYDFDLRASHARTLLPAALASVSFGFVLVRVRVRVRVRAHNTIIFSLLYWIRPCELMACLLKM